MSTVGRRLRRVNASLRFRRRGRGRLETHSRRARRMRKPPASDRGPPAGSGLCSWSSSRRAASTAHRVAAPTGRAIASDRDRLRLARIRRLLGRIRRASTRPQGGGCRHDHLVGRLAKVDSCPSVPSGHAFGTSGGGSTVDRLSVEGRSVVGRDQAGRLDR